MIWQRLAITTILTICAIFNLATGGNISIQKPGNQTGEMPYECGRNVTLICNFKKNTFAISWMNATDIIPIVKCTQNKCVLTSEYNGQYTFTYDIQGIFNLTVIKLTKEDNGRKLICSDGSDSDYEVMKVTDYEPLLFEDTISGTVRAISGCISQDIEVSFKWIKVSVSSGIEEEIILTIHDNNTRRCSNDSDCGNDQQVQYTEIISAKSSDNGKYFLKVLAVYRNESKESFTTAYKYMIEEHDKERINIPIVIYIISSIGVIAVLVLLIGFGYYVRKRLKQRKKEKQRIHWQRHVEEYTKKKLLQKEKENDTSTCPLLEEQDDSRMKKSEEQRETTTDPLRHVEEYTQKRLLEKEKENDTSACPLLEEQGDSRMKKSEEQRETTTDPNMDKPPANKEDIMERKKDLFERRRLNRINNKESDLNLR